MLQLTGTRVVGTPSSHAIAVVQQDIDEERGIGRIVLGATGCKGLTQLGQHLRIHREERQVLILREGVDQWSLALLEGNGERAIDETGAQGVGPIIDRLGAMLQDQKLTRLATGGL